ncbi:MAG: hypothetical protein Ct9H300mP1_12290 [Planctomycetaceae bacterium]|nr:MAG: hypothetical protein Ct9H300mP1_12290 [Planctomycetaceae bacterium]
MLRCCPKATGRRWRAATRNCWRVSGKWPGGQGMFLCPEAGAVWAAAKRLCDSGWLDAEERIVLFNTGSGLKYNHLYPPGDLPTLDHTDPNCLDALD